jgi:hypothetical protein
MPGLADQFVAAQDHHTAEEKKKKTRLRFSASI